MNQPTVVKFRSAASGLWYDDPDAAGDIVCVDVNGKRFYDSVHSWASSREVAAPPRPPKLLILDNHPMGWARVDEQSLARLMKFLRRGFEGDCFLVLERMSMFSIARDDILRALSEWGGFEVAVQKTAINVRDDQMRRSRLKFVTMDDVERGALHGYAILPGSENIFHM